MEFTYKENFIIHDLLEQNQYQRVYLGQHRASEEEVIINELQKGDFLTTHRLQVLRDGLPDLILFEEDDEKAVMISEYRKHASIAEHLTEGVYTNQFRMNLLHEYLVFLMQFDSLPPILQYIMASPNQFFMSGHDLCHSGLLVFSDEVAPDEVSFQLVKEKINNFAQEVLATKTDGSTTIMTIMATYFKDMASDDSFDSIEKITDGFKRIYIYDIYLKDEPGPAPVVAPEPLKKKEKAAVIEKKESKITPTHIAIGLIALAILLILFTGNLFSLFNGDDLPEASFVAERLEDSWLFRDTSTVYGSNNKITVYEWKVYGEGELLNTFKTKDLNLAFKKEGNYTILLRVKDDFGNWSKTFQQEIYHASVSLDPLEEERGSDGPEKLDNLEITLDGEAISYDELVYRNGSKSIQMTFTGQETKGIILDDLFLDNQFVLTFWIKGEPVDRNIAIEGKGFNGQASTFQERTNLTLLDDTWKKVELKETITLTDQVIIYITASDVTLWIDDIDINAYK